MSNSDDNVSKLELYWPGKGASGPISLPFQTIETINSPIIEDQHSNWKNRLIWGENFLVMSSLLKEFAGKIKLIYIDPPFATGQDFSYTVNIGEHTDATKMPSAIEVKAYRDTWGKGIQSYLQTMYSRLFLMKELLADNGSIYVHLDYHVGHYVKIIMDEIFGRDNFINEIIWKRYHGAKNNAGSKWWQQTDTILWYGKSENYIYHGEYTPLSEDYIKKEYKFVDEDGRRYREARRSLRSKYKVEQNRYYLDEAKGAAVSNLWNDITHVVSNTQEYTRYATQKPEALLNRIIKASTNEGDLVADFFAGSGTTGAVAEKLGRRWIMADLGRFAVHTSRKRLLDIDAKPFIVQNLGKYERQHWVKMNGCYTDYLKFILELYHGDVSEDIVRQFRQAFRLLHGKKSDEYIHIGNVDAPITLSEIREALQECRENNISKLVVLGWEWQLGLHELVYDEAHPYGVKLRLLQIPREVMELSANDLKNHEIQFFELASLEIDAKITNKNVIITLIDFIIPHPDLLPIEVTEKVSNWSDYIDYWSVDWMSNQRSSTNKTIFHNMDQKYRTRENSTLNLSMNHVYDKSGNYQILVKVIDIFGNDTTKMIEVKVS
ncbi:TPA: site-specific DNA-methyltransferase [Legionella pneumophila]|nr:site-specific DNA-methyltransferase [Legionella pneumophila]HCK0603795.1 site-specific DNA-methyltransferase [Legionella pneumophila]